MKLWVPDVPDPRLVDTDKEAGQWNEIMREVYEMDNYSFKGCKIEKGDAFICNGAMYTRYGAGVIGNIFDGWMNDTQEVECENYGGCNPCDRPRRTEVL